MGRVRSSADEAVRSAAAGRTRRSRFRRRRQFIREIETDLIGVLPGFLLFRWRFSAEIGSCHAHMCRSVNRLMAAPTLRRQQELVRGVHCSVETLYTVSNRIASVGSYAQLFPAYS